MLGHNLTVVVREMDGPIPYRLYFGMCQCETDLHTAWQIAAIDVIQLWVEHLRGVGVGVVATCEENGESS